MIAPMTCEEIFNNFGKSARVVLYSDAEAVERDRDQWRDLCTRQGMELKAVEVERDALREDKNRIEKVMQLGCQDSESVCPYWQTVKDWEKECDSLEIKNADLQAALAAAQGEVERLRKLMNIRPVNCDPLRIIGG